MLGETPVSAYSIHSANRSLRSGRGRLARPSLCIEEAENCGSLWRGGGGGGGGGEGGAGTGTGDSPIIKG